MKHPFSNPLYYVFFWMTIFTFIFISCSKKDAPIQLNGPALPGTVAQTDTLRVMAYNVLNYGDLCQGSTSSLDGYLRTIVQYARPDLLSCEKMTAFPLQAGTPGNLADEIRDSVLNTVFPGSYAYADLTNASGGDKMSVLFYNRQKLTFKRTRTLLALVEDFDMYQFYYNDPNLSITKDTTFIYVVVCHTKSGGASLERDFQDSAVMASLKNIFHTLPNLIVMGDLNTSGSYEQGYQSFIGSKDSLTALNDPPYFPDQSVTYPGNWSVSPYYVAPYVTTSTRSLPYSPNSCGSSGGGKGWYDHILLSNWLKNGSNYIRYIPESYRSVGNDGNRIGLSINDSFTVVNTSAPPDVLDALFHFSDKYPVMINLEMHANVNAESLPDPGK
jgi:hypothetical protein